MTFRLWLSSGGDRGRNQLTLINGMANSSPLCCAGYHHGAAIAK
jgi:hypothetical protein